MNMEQSKSRSSSPQKARKDKESDAEMDDDDDEDEVTVEAKLMPSFQALKSIFSLLSAIEVKVDMKKVKSVVNTPQKLLDGIG
jgi:hypothetical protein